MWGWGCLRHPSIHPWKSFIREQSSKATSLVTSLRLTIALDLQSVRPSVCCVVVALQFRVRLRCSAPLLHNTAMVGGGHGSSSSHNITHGGLSLHATKGWHSRVGQGMCAVMWFWVLYRAKQDGAVLMGWRHPWDGHGHGGHDEEAKHH